MKLLWNVIRWALLAAPFLYAGQAPAQDTHDSSPKFLTQCENPDVCSTWTFSGDQGQFTLANGIAAGLILKHLDSNSFSIRATSKTPTAVGLVAIYTGVRKGDRLEGTETWSWPGHGSGTLNWYGKIQLTGRGGASPTKAFLDQQIAELSAYAKTANAGLTTDAIPGGMTECEDFLYCATWSFQGNQGHGQWTKGAIADLTLEHSDARSISIRRVDTTGAYAGYKALYTGTRNGDLLEGTVNWSWPGHGAMSQGTTHWTAAIHGLPVRNINLLLDAFVDVPGEKESPPPPPSPQWHSPDNSVAGFDLNGTWQMAKGTPGTAGYQVEKIQVFQIRNAISITNLEGHPFITPGEEFIYGPSTRPNIYDASIRALNGGKMATMRVLVTATDTDHFTIGTGWNYSRISRSAVRDMPCDVPNPSHVSGQEAYERGQLYFGLKDIPTADCWYYVGAMQGYALAQDSYGYALRKGRGVAQDSAWAFYWFRESAMQGDYLGALNLSQMFDAGEGTPPSAQRANYWDRRARVMDPSFVHSEAGDPIPDWARTTSDPCEGSNPTHADASQALVKGRIAFEADAYHRAACWFHISSNQGNTKAKVYLGILYTFGWGTQHNPTVGFLYMKKAAEEGDYFAVVYLANFYRFGFGTLQDAGHAQLWQKRAFLDPGKGSDAYNLVQGLQLDAANAAKIAANLAKDRAEQASCVDARQASGDRRPGYEISGSSCDRDLALDIIFAAKDAAHPTLETPDEIYPEFP
jgi:TPR repeat protein